MSTSATQSLKHHLTDEDDKSRPFKKVIIEDSLFDDLTTRTESPTTTLEIGLYTRRQRIGRPVNTVREKKKDMVSAYSIAHSLEISK